MKYIIFNWKSYLNVNDSELLANFISKNDSVRSFKIIIAPSTLSLSYLKSKFKQISFSSQNFDIYGKGGFTSFIPLSDLDENNIKYCLIGHSEVRKNRGEKDRDVKKKLNLSNNFKITPIVCIGEDLITYKKKLTKKYIKKQLLEIFDKKTNYNNVLLAYEPLWAIGSGLIPSTEEISNIIDFIKLFLKDYSFKKLKILYGGSVNLDNLDEFSQINKLDGFLVGSASIKKSFIKKFLK